MYETSANASHVVVAHECGHVDEYYLNGDGAELVRSAAGLADLPCFPCYEAAAAVDQEYEGPSCSLCDALGHGFPGGGPCPLEMRGAYEPDEPIFF